MSEPLLEIDDVTIEYETRDTSITAVSNASFAIEEGEYFGLVGESGCGKSTLAKSIIGTLDDNGRITDGAIRYEGKEIQDMSERELNEEVRWSEISVIPQGSMSSLDPLRSVEAQALDIAEAHDFPKEEALANFSELLEIVGIDEERMSAYPHELSGGMQQRMLIALSLFLEPTIVISDEPTTALDVIVQDQIFKYLESIKRRLGKSMLLITHDISLIFESCDRVAIMHGGQIAEVGTTRELYHEPRHPYSILLQRAFPDIRYPHRDLEVIEGKPPKAVGEVTQCTFADRCPWAEEECYERPPALEAIDSDSSHRAACFRKNEIEELSEAKDD